MLLSLCFRIRAQPWGVATLRVDVVKTLGNGRLGRMARMYLRRCRRAKGGKRHAYWALVKSVRTANGPRQQLVAYLGEMDEVGRWSATRRS